MSQAWGGESWSIAEPEPTSGPTTCSLTRMHTHARMFFLMTNDGGDQRHVTRGVSKGS